MGLMARIDAKARQDAEWSRLARRGDDPSRVFVPAWVARNIRKDQPLVAVKELSRV